MEVVRCSVCRKEYAEDAVVRMGDYLVCSECRPVSIQRLQEGASLSGEMVYAGFWIRIVAKIVDGIVLWAVGHALGLLEVLIGGPTLDILSIAVNIGYVTYFVGAYGATLGKMVCGLKVVRPDGQDIGYGRAFGRFWAELLSALILCIGYLMVAFDDEKRALHDRICDTRVVKE